MEEGNGAAVGLSGLGDQGLVLTVWLLNESLGSAEMQHASVHAKNRDVLG